MLKIIHFTTVHPRTDPRIALKEVATLANAFPDSVTLYVQDGLGGGQLDSGARVCDTGKVSGGRLNRLLFGSWRMLKALLKEKPDIAHFHDPELILVGLVLKIFGITVIYDVHENVPDQIKSKEYIPSWLRKVLSVVAVFVERFAAACFDGVVLIGEVLEERFPKEKSVVIHNYPLAEEFSEREGVAYSSRDHKFFYAGGITPHRGAFVMVESIGDERLKEAKLVLAGDIHPPELLDDLMKKDGWNRSEYLGWQSREGVVKSLSEALAGLVVLRPEPNYLSSYPTKMYEYMAAGLPIIASDFPFWRDILNGVECAIYVDPCNEKEVADAMCWIINNPEQAEAMGLAGRKLMMERFSWNSEGLLLIDFYKKLLGK